MDETLDEKFRRSIDLDFIALRVTKSMMFTVNGEFRAKGNVTLTNFHFVIATRR